MRNKQSYLVISSDEEEPPTQRKKLIRNDLDQFNQSLKEEILAQRKHKIIEDDESSSKEQINSNDTLKQKKKMKLIKKQELVMHIAQQETTQCPICYNDLAKLETVILECNHLFCQRCIKTQSEYQTSCPLCRKNFKNYTLCFRSEDGEYLRGQLIKMKIKQKPKEYLDDEEDDGSDIDEQENEISNSNFIQDSQYDAGDSFIVEDDEFCEVCQGADNMEAMIFCKKCSRILCHSYCKTYEQNKLLCLTCRTYQQR